MSTNVAGQQPAPTAASPADSDQDLLRPEVRFRPLRVLRSVPAAIWLITALFTLLLASWSVLAPQYHAPGESRQVDAVMRLAEGKGWPPSGHATALSPETAGSLAAAPSGTGPFTEEHATARADRPAWGETTAPAADEAGPQTLTRHPPLYHLIGAGLVKLVPGAPQDLRYDLVIGILRLMSVLMVAPLPLIAWASAERLTARRAAGRVAALVPLAIPMLTHVGSTVNSDALLVLTGALTTLTVCYVLRGDTSLRTAGWTGLFLGAGLLVKSAAVVFVPLALAAALLAWRRARAAARKTPAVAGSIHDQPTAPAGAPFLLADAAAAPAAPARAARFPWAPLLVGALVTLAAGGWWHAVEYARYGTLRLVFAAVGDTGPLAGWRSFADVLVNGTIARWWGVFGGSEARLPVLAARIGTVAVAVLVAAGIAQARTRARRVDLLAMTWPTLALFAALAVWSALRFDDSRRVPDLSWTYLFTGTAALAVAVGAGAASTGALARFAPLVVLAAATACQVVAVGVLLRHWWTPAGAGPRAGADNLLAYAPWPALAVETVAGLTALALVATVVWAIVFAARPVPRDPGERDDRRATATIPSLSDLVAAQISAGDTSGESYDWFGTGAPGGEDDGAGNARSPGTDRRT